MGDKTGMGGVDMYMWHVYKNISHHTWVQKIEISKGSHKQKILSTYNTRIHTDKDL